MQVLKKKPDFKEKPWPSISASAKDFVKKLLVKDPRARLTASQALCRFLTILITFGNCQFRVACRHMLFSLLKLIALSDIL